MEILALYAIPFALAAVVVVLLLGLLNLMRGGRPQRSQKLMQLRIVLQAVALCIVMTAIYFMSK